MMSSLPLELLLAAAGEGRLGGFPPSPDDVILRAFASSMSAGGGWGYQSE